ncbi:MAG: hypothetical protein O7F74_06630 [Bacteroidetes bacterium]|nr:hypothetical protein [Bacteroidota bacterium]
MNNEKLLRLSLKANVIFSILSSLTAVFLGTSSKAVLEMASGNGMAFGIQLLIFGAFVFYNAIRSRVSQIMIYIIILLDILYFLGVFARLWVEDISYGGSVLMIFTGLIVGILALLQFIGLRKAMDLKKISN